MADSNEILMSALAQLLESENSDEMQQIKLRILERIAEETEVKPTRIPAPLNITEVGGYYNLIEEINTSAITMERQRAAMEQKKLEMQMSLISSALGLPV